MICYLLPIRRSSLVEKQVHPTDEGLALDGSQSVQLNRTTLTIPVMEPELVLLTMST